MEDLFKWSLKIIMFFSKTLSKKPILAKFFEKAYKIKVIIVFLILATLVLRHLSLDLT